MERSRFALVQNNPGIVYFFPGQARNYPAVCINALRRVYKHGRDNQPERGDQGLDSECAFAPPIPGRDAIPSRELFLYFFLRLAAEDPRLDSHRSTEAPLRERVRERTTLRMVALEMGMRILNEDKSFEKGYLCMWHNAHNSATIGLRSHLQYAAMEELMTRESTSIEKCARRLQRL
ncbi:hypothetical protein IWZ01DRAFT_544662 [Phyllosticta capitalensis]